MDQLAEILRDQDGTISRRQLLECGFPHLRSLASSGAASWRGCTPVCTSTTPVR